MKDVSMDCESGPDKFPFGIKQFNLNLNYTIWLYRSAKFKGRISRERTSLSLVG